MQTRIELRQDGDDVRIKADTEVDIQAALRVLIDRGVVRPGLVGVRSVLGRAFVEGDFGEIGAALILAGYKVV